MIFSTPLLQNMHIIIRLSAAKCKENFNEIKWQTGKRLGKWGLLGILREKEMEKYFFSSFFQGESS